LHANEERYAAYRELERLKDEMRARAADEDIRQRELFNAIVRNPMPLAYDSKFSDSIQSAITRAQAPEAGRTLPSDSKYLPVAHGANAFDIRAIRPDERHELMKHQLQLHDLFPPRLALRAKESSLERADDSVNVAAIDVKNEKLMRRLGKVEREREAGRTKPLDDFIQEMLHPRSTPRSPAALSEVSSVPKLQPLYRPLLSRKSRHSAKSQYSLNG